MSCSPGCYTNKSTWGPHFTKDEAQVDSPSVPGSQVGPCTPHYTADLTCSATSNVPPLLLGGAHLTVRNIVPVRGQELEAAQLDDVKELVLVPLRAPEGGEATQEDVQDHARGPHVHFQPVTCATAETQAKLRPGCIRQEETNVGKGSSRWQRTAAFSKHEPLLNTCMGGICCQPLQTGGWHQCYPKLGPQTNASL